MTSKNNDQKNNDKNLSEETTSAPLAEKDTPKKESEPTKPEQPNKVEFEEKQGKRGVKLGTVAIVLSLIFGGGLTYKMLEQQSEYQTQIAQLQSQLEQAQSAMKQELSQVKEETIEKATTVLSLIHI